MSLTCVALDLTAPADTRARDSLRQSYFARHGKPKIFNTDQDSQFTGAEFIAVLKAQGIRISMDSKGCSRDNVFVERLWKRLKYEEVSTCMQRLRRQGHAVALPLVLQLTPPAPYA